ncbi:MAG: hypothetical protein U1B30_03065 [Pseudomonadota bacterium]|nr:hypothetical protein [Pseudomonadota bacterium]
MTRENLKNLAKINQLKAEPPDQREFDGMVRSATVRLIDAKNSTLSRDSRFDLAYNAAHSLALAALRRCGYRSDKRYLVFQCLPHTLGFNAAKTRVFSLCHDKRNLSEYEGYLEIDEQLLEELLLLTQELLDLVKGLGPIKP